MATVSEALTLEVWNFIKCSHLFFFDTALNETGVASTAAADVYKQSRIYTPVTSAADASSFMQTRGEQVLGVRPGANVPRPPCSVRPENARFIAPLWRPTLTKDELSSDIEPDYTISDYLSGDNARLVVENGMLVLSPSTEVMAYPGATDLSLCTTAALWYSGMNRVYHFDEFTVGTGTDNQKTLRNDAIALQGRLPEGYFDNPSGTTSSLTSLPFAFDVDNDAFAAAKDVESNQFLAKGLDAKSTVPNVFFPLVRQLTVGAVGSGANVEIAGNRVVRFVLGV